MAGGGFRHDDDGLREPLELLRQEISLLGQRIERAGGTAGAPSANAGFHARRFLPFYAIAAVWALILVVVPASKSDSPSTEVVGLGARSDSPAAGSYDAGTSLGTTDGATAIDAAGAAATTTGTVVAGPAGAATTAGRDAAKPTLQKVAGVVSGAGITRGGFECKPGVRQIPWSTYAGQCLAKFEGTNGGATARGVTADKIILATRNFPDSANSQAVSAFAQAAGAADEDVAREVNETFKEWFQKTFELYGRRVEFVKFEASSQSNSTDEAQSKGKEGACIDATKVSEEIKAFAVTGSSGPFSECLAERKVTTLGGGAYFPESWYRKYHPYIFNGVTDCERIVTQQAEYMGKRLLGKKAKWAGDALLKQQDRKFGIYIPNNDEYQHCGNVLEKEFKSKYGGTIASRYNYTLDVSRFPDEAARGMVQFKAAGVTTILNDCDPISTTVASSAATSQNYFPEWFLPGVALQDVDSVARLYDAQQRNKNSIFGMSQLGAQEKLWGPNSEPGITYKRITGKDIPAGTEGGYFGLVQIFNFLQSAGPNLTAQTLERGIHSIMPGGAPSFAVGYVSYQDGSDGTPGATDHTGIDDSREIYWCDTCPSKVDGKAGTYLETYGGKRFRNNEWAREDPPIYPPGFDKK